MMLESVKSALLVGLLIVVSIGAYQYYSVWSGLEEKLAEARQDKAKLEASEKVLTQTVTALEAKEKAHESEIEDKQKLINKQLQKIATLEDQFKAATLGTLGLVKEQAIAKEFKSVYKYEDPSIKVRKFPIVDPLTGKVLKNRQGQDVTEPYLTVPIDYIKEMILARVEVKTCQEQKALQSQVITLEQEKTRLTGEIATLREEKAESYAKAYKEAYDTFNKVHESYVELLKAPPKVDLMPNWLQIAGGLLGGIALCKL